MLAFSACLSSGTKWRLLIISHDRDSFENNLMNFMCRGYCLNLPLLPSQIGRESIHIIWLANILSTLYSLLLDGAAGRKPVSICEVLPYLTHLQQQLSMILKNKDVSGKKKLIFLIVFFFIHGQFSCRTKFLLILKSPF